MWLMTTNDSQTCVKMINKWIMIDYFIILLINNYWLINMINQWLILKNEDFQKEKNFDWIMNE